MADALDETAELFFARWKRAVDILWRETVRAPEPSLRERDRKRAARRRRNLQRIVRRALGAYHAIELERQRRDQRRRTWMRAGEEIPVVPSNHRTTVSRKLGSRPADTKAPVPGGPASPSSS